MSSAEQITRRSKSNLAFAFFSLPPDRRRDMTTFYAFCRQVDDWADHPGIPLAERQRWLRGWRTWIRQPEPGEPEFAPDVRAIIARYGVNLQLLEDILSGVESDLSPARFPTFKELSEYCYRVASAVGLVSIEIFGYQNPVCRDYARYLGTALQLTNIVRDVETDLKNGERIYLPLDELAQFGYSENDLIRRVYDQRFLALMEHQAARARDFFHKADTALPRADRYSMLPARMMHQIYFGLLKRIERDRFRMFWKRYRLSKLEKVMIILPLGMSQWWQWL